MAHGNACAITSVTHNPVGSATVFRFCPRPWHTLPEHFLRRDPLAWKPWHCALPGDEISTKSRGWLSADAQVYNICFFL